MAPRNLWEPSSSSRSAQDAEELKVLADIVLVPVLLAAALSSLVIAWFW